MTPYSEFRPTAVDTKGLGLPDRQDWLVAPVSVNRDSGCLERSNWTVVRDDLEKHDSTDTEESDLERHSFGHWACGWFDILLVRPGSKAAKRAQQWEDCLTDYPVASDSHYSDLQYGEACECWRSLNYRARRALGATRAEAKRQRVPIDNDLVWKKLTDG